MGERGVSRRETVRCGGRRGLMAGQEGGDSGSRMWQETKSDRGGARDELQGKGRLQLRYI